VNRIWVWFIGVWLIVICLSRRTGCGDSSNPDAEDACGVVAVPPACVVVVAAAEALIIDVVIIASMKIVAAAVIIELFFFLLLRCFISLSAKHEYYG
jgi:uncharacterized membrane protein